MFRMAPLCWVQHCSNEDIADLRCEVATCGRSSSATADASCAAALVHPEPDRDLCRCSCAVCLTCPRGSGIVDQSRTKCIPLPGYTLGRNGFPTPCPAGTAKGEQAARSS